MDLCFMTDCKCCINFFSTMVAFITSFSYVASPASLYSCLLSQNLWELNYL